MWAIKYPSDKKILKTEVNTELSIEKQVAYLKKLLKTELYADSSTVAASDSSKVFYTQLQELALLFYKINAENRERLYKARQQKA